MEEIAEANWDNKQQPSWTGRKITSAANVVKEATKYWKSLFTRRPINPTHFKACLDTLRTGNRVLPPTAEKCDADITEEEVASVLNTLPLGKSSGPDRIPNKFYRTFSKLLSPILTHVFNESREADLFYHELIDCFSFMGSDSQKGGKG